MNQSEPITQALIAQLREGKSVILRSPIDEKLKSCSDCSNDGMYWEGDPYSPDIVQCEFCNVIEDSVYNYMESTAKHKVGDHVKLLEEWQFFCNAEAEWGTFRFKDGTYKDFRIDDLLPETEKLLRNTEDAVNEWQPSNTLPEEISQYTAEVLRVDCKQLRDVSHVDQIDLMVGWNHRHPNVPFEDVTWIFETEIKLIKEEMK